MKLILRSEWGAGPTNRAQIPLAKSKFLNYYGHWLGQAYPERMTDVQIMQSIQRYHRDTKKWGDIGYNYAIGRQYPSNVYIGRGENRGAQAVNQNSTSMGIVFLIGQGEKPTPEMLVTFHELVEFLRARGWHQPDGRVVVLPHMDSPYAETACAGPDLSPWLRAYKHQPGPPPAGPSTNQGDTMSDMPNLDDTQFVEHCYTSILKRPSDPEGLAFWTGKLERAEMSRNDLRWEFLAVRLDATEMALAAAAEVAGGHRIHLVAREAYNLFLHDLRKLTDTTP